MTNDEMTPTPDSENSPDEVLDSMEETPEAAVSDEAAAGEEPEPVEANIDEEPELLETEADEDSEPVELDAELDVEAALAAVASLGSLTGDEELEAESAGYEIQEYRVLETAEDDGEAIGETEDMAEAEGELDADMSGRAFARPPLMTLRRGQMGSVVPALLLIGTGVWLTLAMTTGASIPGTDLLILIAIGGISLTLLAQWLSSGRWTRGGFLGAALALALAAGLFVLTRPASPGLIAGWPLLLVAIGAAFVLTGILSHPRTGRLTLAGFLLAAGGAAGYTVTGGLLPSGLVTTLGTLWPVAVVAVLILLLLPLVPRRPG